MDIVEIARTGATGVPSERIFGHLLTDGAEFLDRNHLRGADVDRVMLQLCFLLTFAVFVFAQIDGERASMASPDDKGLPPEVFQFAAQPFEIHFFDELEGQLVSTP